MYLDLCGKIEKKEDTFTALFHQDLSNIELRNDELPVFLIMEGLVQISCRAASQSLFNNKPCFPASINQFRYSDHVDKIDMKEEGLRFATAIENRGSYGVSMCKLLNRNNDIIVDAEVWVAVREGNEGMGVEDAQL